MISLDDFQKCDIRVGTILSAEKVPEADRLVKLMIDLGEPEPRQIISGIALFFPDPSVLVGRQVPVLANLEPRTIRGLESKGMVLYAVGETDGKLSLLKTISPSENVPNGTSVR